MVKMKLPAKIDKLFSKKIKLPATTDKIIIITALLIWKILYKNNVARQNNNNFIACSKEVRKKSVTESKQNKNTKFILFRTDGPHAPKATIKIGLIANGAAEISINKKMIAVKKYAMDNIFIVKLLIVKPRAGGNHPSGN